MALDCSLVRRGSHRLHLRGCHDLVDLVIVEHHVCVLKKDDVVGAVRPQTAIAVGVFAFVTSEDDLLLFVLLNLAVGLVAALLGLMGRFGLLEGRRRRGVLCGDCGSAFFAGLLLRLCRTRGGSGSFAHKTLID